MRSGSCDGLTLQAMAGGGSGFSIPRVRHRIPSHHNPFNYFDRSIISIDTLKNNLEYRNYLEKAPPQLTVVLRPPP
jgi:hypothetical protein